ncbi:signal recognition particle-docking protein FtsY [Xylocopilactobacillus apis]|uniref:Signal recognition particle receptor FtsY n=1 Tax=Xylocopilactobacillus apis TaxID=2932183 RepID=A0AAU9D1F1_9LACO|nr:signal recognition particle-docking protein FtsY [Xylocopilactobacillus apis]BDR56105.1 signal recognition particle receptor FtsY [Xylocopilactobacillus apis]
MGLFDKLKKSLFGNNSEEEKNEEQANLSETDDLKESENDSADEGPASETNVPLDQKTDETDISDQEPEEAEIPTHESEKDEVDNFPEESDHDKDQKEKETIEVTSNETEDKADKNENDQEENIEVDNSPEESDHGEDQKEEETIEVTSNETEEKTDITGVASEDQPEKENDDSKPDQKYQSGLKKSRNSFAAGFNHFLAKFRTVDNQFFDDLEDFLIESDVGYELTMDLTDQLKEMVKEENLKTKEQIGQAIVQYLVDSYDTDEAGKALNQQDGLNIYLFVGVNGAGKTTTIGKLANRLVKEGKKVILVAGDTFRAGATEQLDRWAVKTGAEIVKGKTNQDPASLVFEGIHRAKEENADYLMIDTAGRLQNKVNLMNELDKIKRTIKKEAETDPTETLLVIDATTGQNGLNQAKEFNQVTKLSGLVLSKLDGTAKGGIVLQIKKSLNIPVKLVGLGEHVDDLVDFDPVEFMRGFFSGILQV